MKRINSAFIWLVVLLLLPFFSNMIGGLLNNFSLSAYFFDEMQRKFLWKGILFIEAGNCFFILTALTVYFGLKRFSSVVAMFPMFLGAIVVAVGNSKVELISSTNSGMQLIQVPFCGAVATICGMMVILCLDIAVKKIQYVYAHWRQRRDVK
ncbi:MAG: hypothetical protein RRY34_01595 [Victivallaceae bacterium]